MLSSICEQNIIELTAKILQIKRTGITFLPAR
jgi:hypothetical protein